MVQKLREGEPSIEVGPGSRQQLQIGVWMMDPGEDAIVGERIRSILASTRYIKQDLTTDNRDEHR